MMTASEIADKAIGEWSEILSCCRTPGQHVVHRLRRAGIDTEHTYKEVRDATDWVLLVSIRHRDYLGGDVAARWVQPMRANLQNDDRGFPMEFAFVRRSLEEVIPNDPEPQQEKVRFPSMEPRPLSEHLQVAAREGRLPRIKVTADWWLLRDPTPDDDHTNEPKEGTP